MPCGCDGTRGESSGRTGQLPAMAPGTRMPRALFSDEIRTLTPTVIEDPPCRLTLDTVGEMIKTAFPEGIPQYIANKLGDLISNVPESVQKALDLISSGELVADTETEVIDCTQEMQDLQKKKNEEASKKTPSEPKKTLYVVPGSTGVALAYRPGPLSIVGEGRPADGYMSPYLGDHDSHQLRPLGGQPMNLVAQDEKEPPRCCRFTGTPATTFDVFINGNIASPPISIEVVQPPSFVVTKNCGPGIGCADDVVKIRVTYKVKIDKIEVTGQTFHGLTRQSRKTYTKQCSECEETEE